jgi:hypothetical protein
MISILLSGLMAAAATVAALAPGRQSQPFGPPANVFTGVVLSGSIATTVVRTEFKCHSRMVQVDPELDARIRILIPEERRAGSKIRTISPSCGNSAQVVHGFTETVRVRAGSRK